MKTVEEFLSRNPQKAEVREFLKNSSEEMLREFLRSVSASHNFYKYAETELLAKLSEEERKPHWTTWLIVLFTIVGAVAAVFAAYFAWRGLYE